MTTEKKSSISGSADAIHVVRLYFLHAMTPLHAGIGEGVGAINLPTARERFTGYPFMPGSSVKGVLRDHAEQTKDGGDESVIVAFGPPSENAADARGGLALSDANLLCLPIRSLFGTFAWVTCPLALRRFARDAAEAQFTPPALPPDDDLARLPTNTSLVAPNNPKGLFLEEVHLSAHFDSAEANAWAKWIGEAILAKEDRAFFASRFVIVPNDIFSFYTKLCLEVRNRVKIDDDRGTAAKSGPWTEEHLPAETLLYGLAIARPTAFVKRGKDNIAEDPKARAANVSARVLDELLQQRPMLRFGGHASVGLGRARIGLASIATEDQ